jgi:hypothetical protein
MGMVATTPYDDVGAATAGLADVSAAVPAASVTAKVPIRVFVADRARGDVGRA